MNTPIPIPGCYFSRGQNCVLVFIRNIRQNSYRQLCYSVCFLLLHISVIASSARVRGLFWCVVCGVRCVSGGVCVCVFRGVLELDVSFRLLLFQWVVVHVRHVKCSTRRCVPAPVSCGVSVFRSVCCVRSVVVERYRLSIFSQPVGRSLPRHFGVVLWSANWVRRGGFETTTEIPAVRYRLVHWT